MDIGTKLKLVLKPRSHIQSQGAFEVEHFEISILVRTKVRLCCKLYQNVPQ